MTKADMVIYASEKGWDDGLLAGKYSPPLSWTFYEDVDDAYMTSYWHSFSHIFMSAADYREQNGLT